MHTVDVAFRSHPNAEKRRNSAAVLIKMILANKTAGVLPEHIRSLIDTLLWRITEADGKYNTRYKTRGAINCTDKNQLRHEHVYQKARMIEALINADPDAVDTILDDAIGCTVTNEEHRHLNEFDCEYGWERYRKAGLEVIDMINHERKV